MRSTDLQNRCVVRTLAIDVNRDHSPRQRAPFRGGVQFASQQLRVHIPRAGFAVDKHRLGTQVGNRIGGGGKGE